MKTLNRSLAALVLLAAASWAQAQTADALQARGWAAPRSRMRTNKLALLFTLARLMLTR